MQVNEEDKGLVPSATILRINEQARRLPPVLGEFAVQERAQLLERIAELEKDLDDALINWAQVRLELAALKARAALSANHSEQVRAVPVECRKLLSDIEQFFEGAGVSPGPEIELRMAAMLAAAPSAGSQKEQGE